MTSSIKSLSQLIRQGAYWSGKMVVRWPLIVALLVIWGVYYWLRQEYAEDDSTFWIVMELFLKLLIATMLGLFIIMTLLSFATWLHFAAGLRRHEIQADVKFGDGQKAEAGQIPVEVRLTGTLFRPPFGSIRAQLIFSDQRVSQPVVLDTNLYKGKSFWKYAIRGSGNSFLHDRGIYDVVKIRITFHDMFGLLAWPSVMPFTRQLFTLPRKQDPTKAPAEPRSTEEQKHRITIPRRVEGELINYKEFEPGDNIQRIVWKIYAKSGELVVRVPEIKDPYASHLYFYASFFAQPASDGAFERELLNVYKDRVRNLFEALNENGYDVRIPADQEIPKLAGLGDRKTELFQITSSAWQNHQPPTMYVKPQRAAFVCVSSLVPIEEAEWLVKNLPDHVPLVVIRLADAIPSPFRFSLKDVFFRPEPGPADHLRQPWLLSGLRRQLQKNELELGRLVKNRSNAWMADAITWRS